MKLPILKLVQTLTYFHTHGQNIWYQKLQYYAESFQMAG
jgi:hypothetical protein